MKFDEINFININEKYSEDSSGESDLIYSDCDSENDDIQQYKYLYAVNLINYYINNKNFKVNFDIFQHFFDIL